MVDLTFTTLPNQRDTLEKEKFELDSTGKVQVRTSAKGTFTASGLKTAGKVTEVTVNSTTWTALPAVPLTGRNAISLQNQDATIPVKINYSNSVIGYVGVIIGANSERHYDITDAIVLYAKSQSGNVVITVEEIS